MGVFGAKIPPTLYRNNIADGNIWLADIGDKRRELLNTQKKINVLRRTGMPGAVMVQRSAREYDSKVL